MLKLHDIIGMPVLEVTTGKELGHVKDVILDGGWNIRGIVLEGTYWFASPRIVGSTDIISFGEDAVTVRNEQCVQAQEPSPDCIYFLEGARKIKGLPIVTVNGNQLGVVQDVYYKEIKGKHIVGYELTEGFLTDLTEGRKWLPFPEKVTFGEDAIIVPLHSDGNLQEIPATNQE